MNGQSDPVAQELNADNRRRFRFSLRSLLILTTIVAVALGLAMREVRQRADRAAQESLKSRLSLEQFVLSVDPKADFRRRSGRGGSTASTVEQEWVEVFQTSFPPDALLDGVCEKLMAMLKEAGATGLWIADHGSDRYSAGRKITFAFAGARGWIHIRATEVTRDPATTREEDAGRWIYLSTATIMSR